MSGSKNTKMQKEYVAELLRERIYATFALIAVLATIDVTHTDPLHAAYIVIGTILSLWAASIVAAIMSRRMIFQDSINHEKEIRHQVKVHAPMLLALFFPLLLLFFAGLHVIPLVWAVNISIVSALLLLVGWSIASAKSLHSKKVPTIVLIVLQLAIGFGIIALKIAVGH